MSLLKIAELQGQIKRRDARIEELEAAQSTKYTGHDSDCSVHNMPAYPAGPCDCRLAATSIQPTSAVVQEACPDNAAIQLLESILLDMGDGQDDPGNSHTMLDDELRDRARIIVKAYQKPPGAAQPTHDLINHLKGIYAFLADIAPSGIADEAFRNVPNSILSDSFRAEKLSLHPEQSDSPGKRMGLAGQDRCAGEQTDGAVAATPPPVAGDGSIVGHKTFSNGDGTFRHEPLRQNEADKIMRRIEQADQRRIELMPTEQDAVRMMSTAFHRLKELGWKETMYGPTNQVVQLIENGSSGIHKGSRWNEWPENTWWIDGDSPSNPCLFKPIEATPSKQEGEQ